MRRADYLKLKLKNRKNGRLKLKNEQLATAVLPK